MPLSSVSQLPFHYNVQRLQLLLLKLNVDKSSCIRFGPRFDANCECLISVQGGLLLWTNRCKYLGVYLKSGRTVRCCFDHSKCQFYKAFNAIFSRVGRLASEEVVLNLLNVKCLPVLLYGVETCRMSTHDKRSLEFTVTRTFMKLFRTGSVTVVRDCQKFFCFLPIINQIDIRTAKFLETYLMSENHICQLFSNRTQCALTDIFLSYDSNINSSVNLRNVIFNSFLGDLSE